LDADVTRLEVRQKKNSRITGAIKAFEPEKMKTRLMKPLMCGFPTRSTFSTFSLSETWATTLEKVDRNNDFSHDLGREPNLMKGISHPDTGLSRFKPKEFHNHSNHVPLVDYHDRYSSRSFRGKTLCINSHLSIIDPGVE
jgi:hypothetical protein